MILAGFGAVLARGAWAGLHVFIHALELVLAGVCFAAGANARPAVVSVRLLDGTAALASAWWLGAEGSGAAG